MTRKRGRHNWLRKCYTRLRVRRLHSRGLRVHSLRGGPASILQRVERALRNQLWRPLARHFDEAARRRGSPIATTHPPRASATAGLRPRAARSIGARPPGWRRSGERTDRVIADAGIEIRQVANELLIRLATGLGCQARPRAASSKATCSAARKAARRAAASLPASAPVTRDRFPRRRALEVALRRSGAQLEDELHVRGSRSPLRRRADSTSSRTRTGCALRTAKCASSPARFHLVAHLLRRHRQLGHAREVRLGDGERSDRHGARRQPICRTARRRMKPSSTRRKRSIHGGS